MLDAGFCHPGQSQQGAAVSLRRGQQLMVLCQLSQGLAPGPQVSRQPPALPGSLGIPQGPDPRGGLAGSCAQPLRCLALSAETAADLLHDGIGAARRRQLGERGRLQPHCLRVAVNHSETPKQTADLHPVPSIPCCPAHGPLMSSWGGSGGYGGLGSNSPRFVLSGWHGESSSLGREILTLSASFGALSCKLVLLVSRGALLTCGCLSLCRQSSSVALRCSWCAVAELRNGVTGASEGQMSSKNANGDVKTIKKKFALVVFPTQSPLLTQQSVPPGACFLPPDTFAGSWCPTSRGGWSPVEPINPAPLCLGSGVFTSAQCSR